MTRVLIVDDHIVLADALSYALRLAEYTVTCARPLDASSVLATAVAFAPDVILLDLDLGEWGSGIDLIDPLATTDAAVVLFTGSRDRLPLARALRAGASGFVLKGAGLDAVIDVVDRAAAGEAIIPVTVRERLLAELRASEAEEHARMRPFERLTRREAQVLRALVRGRSAEAISAEHDVSPATARTQIRSVLQKLGVRSQLAAVALAHEAGWTAGVRL